MTHQDLTALYEQRIPEIEPLIRFKARGDKDLEQVARLGVYQELKATPDASSNRLCNCAKWAMNDERKRGRSLDKPNRNRKLEFAIVEHNEMLHEPLDVFPMNKRTDLETQVINKITVERFIYELDTDEALYTRYKVNDEMSDTTIAEITGWKLEGIRAMKKSIRKKISQAFAC